MAKQVNRSKRKVKNRAKVKQRAAKRQPAPGTAIPARGGLRNG